MTSGFRQPGIFSRDVVTKVILPRFLLIFSRDKVVTSHGLVVTFSHRPKTNASFENFARKFSRDVVTKRILSRIYADFIVVTEVVTGPG